MTKTHYNDYRTAKKDVTRGMEEKKETPDTLLQRAVKECRLTQERTTALYVWYAKTYDK